MSLLLFLATNNALCLWLARKNYSFVFGRDAQNEDIFSPRAVRIKRYCRFTIVLQSLYYDPSITYMITCESRNHHWESRSSLSTTETCSIRSYSVTIQLKLRRNCLTDSLDLENPRQRSEKILPLLGILPTVLRSDISSPICSVVQLLLLPN